MTLRPWTTKELAKLREMKAAGATYAEVAAALNRTPKAVKHMYLKTVSQ
jgi:hypothetical protein